jgi:hypothetical protein
VPAAARHLSLTPIEAAPAHITLGGLKGKVVVYKIEERRLFPSKESSNRVLKMLLVRKEMSDALRHLHLKLVDFLYMAKISLPVTSIPCCWAPPVESVEHVSF